MNLTVHNVYFCFSEVGCTIALRDGTPCKEAPAHTPTLFVAQQPDMVCSDPAAVVKEIPNGLQLLHGQMMKEQVPAWYAPLKAELTALLDGSKFKLAWLASKNTLVVHTDRVSDELLAAVKATAEAAMPEGAVLLQYNHNIEISWRNINKYAECTSISAMKEVNPDFMNDLTSDGEWVYPLEKMVTVGTPQPAGSAPEGLFRYGKIVKFSGAVPNLKSAGAFLRDTPLTQFNTELPKIEYLTHAFNKTRLTEWTVDISTVKGCHGAFMESKLKRFKSELPYVGDMHNMFYNTGLKSFECDSDLKKAYNQSWAFYACQLDKKSALSVLSKSWSGVNVTIGIHVDHKTDEEVLAAIANAEAKGWTLSVQWNGTPTASASVTYGLRKPPIYAKIGEHEMPDGTVERVLDWGHYVTDPTGYEEFRSVEAAREYFGLPDEDLTNN